MPKISFTVSCEEQFFFNETHDYGIMWRCMLNFTHTGKEIWEQQVKTYLCTCVKYECP